MYLDEWGPIAWELFHFITYSYKPKLKNYYIIFFNTLYSLIPCPHCSNDIKNVLLEEKNYPIKHIRSIRTITEWFTNIHNLINIKTNNKNRFTIKDSNNKYLNNGTLTINHERIYKFIKIAIESNINKNDTDLIRNIISLCHIYPSDIHKSNINLIKMCTTKIVNNKEWLEEFRKIDKKENLIHLKNIHFNNLFIYGDKRIYLNKVILKKINNNLNDFTLHEKDENLIFKSYNKNLKNGYQVRMYECLDNINKLRIYISGKTNHCEMKIKIKCGKKISEHHLHSTINETYENISKGENITIFITIGNKKSNNCCAIIDTISLF